MLRTRYIALVFLSAADFALTSKILSLGGEELNPIADWIICDWGISGLIAFKSIVVVSVICTIEYVARRDRRLAQTVITAALVITALPVASGVFQLCRHGWQ